MLLGTARASYLKDLDNAKPRRHWQAANSVFKVVQGWPEFGPFIAQVYFVAPSAGLMKKQLAEMRERAKVRERASRSTTKIPYKSTVYTPV